MLIMRSAIFQEWRKRKKIEMLKTEEKKEEEGLIHGAGEFKVQR